MVSEERQVVPPERAGNQVSLKAACVGKCSYVMAIKACSMALGLNVVMMIIVMAAVTFTACQLACSKHFISVLLAVL